MVTLTVGELRKALADLDLSDSVEVQVCIRDWMDRVKNRAAVEVFVTPLGMDKPQRLRIVGLK